MILKTFWRKKQKNNDKKSLNSSHIDHFKYKTHIEMRLTDSDRMGHVNHAVYFTYLEIARSHYWQHAIHWDWKKTGVVIRHASIDYLHPIFPEDKINVYVRTSRIGQSSFDLEYLIVKQVNLQEIPCSKGSTTCVAIDYHTKKPTPVPEKERQKMIDFEQLKGANQ